MAPVTNMRYASSLSKYKTLTIFCFQDPLCIHRLQHTGPGPHTRLPPACLLFLLCIPNHHRLLHDQHLRWFRYRHIPERGRVRIPRLCLRQEPGEYSTISSSLYNLLITFQRNCIEFALSAKPVRRYIPKNPLQYRLWSFATSPFCEYTVFIAILLNTTSLAMKFYKQPTAYTDFLDVLNQIFTYFFLVECILKLGAFRFKVKRREKL